MMAGNLFFSLCALVALVGALATVLARNPILGAVGLLATILGIAGLFLMLRAQFLAAIQLIVYAGAVVVLFVFVIMLLGPDAGLSKQAPARTRLARLFGAFFLLGLGGVGMLLLASSVEAPTRFGEARVEHGTIEAVGGMLFTRGLVPFELATALLIVAVIGAIAVARVKHVPKEKVLIESPTKRMFHGPLHPRDAGQPLPAREEAAP
jgi:NADH-quinone oxidoreductase subunit J